LQDIKNYIIFANKKGRSMWTELSDPAILQKMGRRMRDYRIRMEMTQGELAEKSGVSMGTIVRVEQGNPVSILLFVSILRTMGLLENLEVLLPELSISPIQMRKLQGKKVMRIRHKKED
jgi:transcriptional regulator with XRE-family HTH domain